MWTDRVSNPGPLAHKLDVLQTALHCPAKSYAKKKMLELFPLILHSFTFIHKHTNQGRSL